MNTVSKNPNSLFMLRIEVHWPSGKFMVLVLFVRKFGLIIVLIKIRNIKITGCNLFIGSWVITAVLSRQTEWHRERKTVTR